MWRRVFAVVLTLVAVLAAGWLALRLRRRQVEADAQEHLSTAERDRARALLAGETPVTADIPSAEEPRS